MVRGRQYSAYTVLHAGASIAEMERLDLDLDSDRFQCFNHRDELYSTVQLPNFRSVGRGTLRYMRRAIYSARIALFIHGIT